MSAAMPSGAAVPSHLDGLAGQLHRRRDAARRCEPLASGVRDPLGSRDDRRSPSSFGMRPGELLAEVERCRSTGWLWWEIRERIADPRTVAA